MAIGEAGSKEDSLLSLVGSTAVSTLNRYKRAIRILRGTSQAEKFNIPEESFLMQTESLAQARGDLYIQGHLCQITDTQTFDHDPDPRKFQEEEGVIAVRGFYVNFDINGIKFICFIFDPTIKNRQYYDQKGQEEKEAFFQAFAKREADKLKTRRGFLEETPVNPVFATFINERRERYSLEKITQLPEPT